MDIEDLSTTQIILLALLVSFVTSIATGIVTVSLLAQAPPAVTNTVNQIVERTIETVVPANDGKPVTTTVKETTVVVKEEDLITSSISSSFGKTGRVYAGTATTSTVVGLASALSSGTVLTDASVVDKEHLIAFSGGSGIFVVSQKFPEIGLAVLVPKSASSTLPSAFRVGDTNALKLGATTIALVSVANERVQTGNVSSRTPLADILRKGKDPLSVRTVDTSISQSLVPGTPLVNIFGDLIGVSTYASDVSGRGSFVSVSDIMPLLTATSTPQQ